MFFDKNILQEVEKIVVNFYEIVLTSIGVEIGSEFQDANNNERETINTADTLRIFPNGNLLDSFIDKNSPFNLASIDIRNGLTFGSSLPYASVHEFGASIKITDKMRSFFWAKWYESNEQNELWKNLALTKKTHITIKPRPYFEPAIKEYADKQFQKDLEEFLLQPLLRLLN